MIFLWFSPVGPALLSALNCRFVEFPDEVVESRDDDLPAGGIAELVSRQVFELLQRDVEAIGWDPHMAIELPQSGHSLLVCELRLSARKGVKDHPEKVEAIPPAGFSPVAGVKRTSWLQQPWPLP